MTKVLPPIWNVWPLFLGKAKTVGERIWGSVEKEQTPSVDAYRLKMFRTVDATASDLPFCG